MMVQPSCIDGRDGQNIFFHLKTGFQDEMSLNPLEVCIGEALEINFFRMLVGQQKKDVDTHTFYYILKYASPLHSQCITLKRCIKRQEFQLKRKVKILLET